MIMTGEREALGEKPVPVTFYSAKFPHELPCDENFSSAVRSQE
jgi:hypothetical protein